MALQSFFDPTLIIENYVCLFGGMRGAEKNAAPVDSALYS